MALPERDEEAPPAFVHAAEDVLPVVEDGGARVRVVVGAVYGARSPVHPLPDALFVDVALESGARVPAPPGPEERAVFVAEGEVEIAGATFPAGQLVVLRPGAPVELRAPGVAARAVLLGGAPLDGPRHVWWNFVSSSAERIAQAKADWAEGRFAQVPGETELIPLPDAPGIAKYP